MTIHQFLTLSPDKQRIVCRWQQENLPRVKRWVGESPDFFIAIDDGCRLIYPVLPNGERIIER
jgi:hypothetical protein